MPHDKMSIFMMADKQIRGAIISSTVMVNQMRAAHELGIIETLALGHAYTAAGLLTCDMKGDETVVLHVDGSGPLKGFAVDANAQGYVRGYLKNKNITIEKELESFDLAPFIGIGVLCVTKYLTRDTNPFTGQVLLKSGNLAEDLVHYYLSSQQIPTAFYLSVKFDKQGNVTGAGGLFLQAMPGADPKTLDLLTEQVKSVPSLGELFTKDMQPEKLIELHFNNFGPEIMESRDIRFECPCNKQKFIDFLSAMPEKEVRGILEEGPLPANITCHKCNSVYVFEEEELKKILKK